MAKNVAKTSLKKELLEIGVAVAAVVVIAELANAARKLQKEGKLNRKDAEKMIQDAFRKYKGEGTKYVKEALAEFDKLAKSSPFVTKGDIARIDAKIKKLSKLSENAAAKGVKKAGKRIRGK